MNRSELLSGTRWDAGLADVLLACPSATAAEEAPLLRKGYAAIVEVAAVQPGLFPALPLAANFEAMLACGGAESAAMSLIPGQAGFMLSRGRDGCHIGSVFMADCGEHTVEGNTAALAVMAAALSAYRVLLRQHALPSRLLH